MLCNLASNRREPKMAEDMHGLLQNNTAHRDSGDTEEACWRAPVRTLAQSAYSRARARKRKRVLQRQITGRKTAGVTSATLRYSCFFTNSHSPRPHMLGHSGRVSPSENWAGVLQTLHQ
jgi:hypothetical protein